MTSSVNMTLPRTGPQDKSLVSYREACERLANATVAQRAADAEHNAALAQYNEAHGAALQAGVIEK